MGKIRFLSVLTGILAGALLPSPAGAWEVRRFDGRDYVETAEVARFYQLPIRQPVSEGAPLLDSGARSIAFRSNTREVVVNGLKHWLAFPVIERDGAHWVSRLDLSRTLEPALRPQLARELEPVTTVVLDPGHGGRDKGAINPIQYEKNFALDLARRVRDALTAKGVSVKLTRNSDIFLELPDRPAVANKIPGAIFVSLHFNSAENRAAQGFEIFAITPRGAPSTRDENLSPRDLLEVRGNENEVPSFLLASCIYHAMHGRVRMVDRGIKRARFSVLRNAGVPAALVEGGFLSNPVDARRVASPEWRTQLAGAIAEGIVAFMRLADRRAAPPLVAEYRLPGSPNLRLVQPAVTPPSTPPPVSLRGLPEEAQPEAPETH